MKRGLLDDDKQATRAVRFWFKLMSTMIVNYFAHAVLRKAPGPCGKTAEGARRRAPASLFGAARVDYVEIRSGKYVGRSGCFMSLVANIWQMFANIWQSGTPYWNNRKYLSQHTSARRDQAWAFMTKVDNLG
jgi:hypothetical protein